MVQILVQSYFELVSSVLFSSRSNRTSIWTSNSNCSCTDKQSSQINTVKEMSVKATFFFHLKTTTNKFWNDAEMLLKSFWSRTNDGGFHLYLLVFPFVYQFNSRILVLVNIQKWLVQKNFNIISASFQNLFVVVFTHTKNVAFTLISFAVLKLYE